MEIPDLVRDRLDGESVETAVNLGDSDVVCFTPTRTLLYRGEGLLSDEGVDVFSHDVERLGISEGRRKTKFVLEYVDGTETFTVPGDRTGSVLERLVDGILTVAGVTDPEESVAGVFRFSELTLVVTGTRLVKHVGEPVWDEDYEEYPFEAVTGLTFEEGSVATQIVVSVNGRPDRIKAPNEQAPKVRETLTKALFTYHDVDSLGALNEKLQAEEDGSEATAATETEGDIGLGDGISPLVESEGESGSNAADPDAGGVNAGSSASGTEPQPQSLTTEPGDSDAVRTDATETTASSGDATDDRSAPDATGGGATTGTVDPEEIEEMRTQLAALTEVVEQQNEQLRKQQETIEQLIEELRRGR